MHLRNITLHPDRFPTAEVYPFNMPVFLATRNLEFRSPTTFLVACPGADIYSFDSAPVSRIRYEDAWLSSPAPQERRPLNRAF
ncbi:MAG: hypothetical protein Q8O92_01160 [Candidatus Latescibacter sp.]|nr:hypothetical protein [Candidatus Latescibacter sp.]